MFCNVFFFLFVNNIFFVGGFGSVGGVFLFYFLDFFGDFLLFLLIIICGIVGLFIWVFVLLFMVIFSVGKYKFGFCGLE